MSNLTEKQISAINRISAEYGPEFGEQLRAKFSRDNRPYTPSTSSKRTVKIPTVPREVPFVLIRLFLAIFSLYSLAAPVVEVVFEEEIVPISFVARSDNVAIGALNTLLVSLEKDLLKARSDKDAESISAITNSIAVVHLAVDQSSGSDGFPVHSSRRVLAPRKFKFNCLPENVPLLKIMIREWRLNHSDDLPDFSKVGFDEIKVDSVLPQAFFSNVTIWSTAHIPLLDYARNLRSVAIEKLQKIVDLLKKLKLTVHNVFSLSSYPDYLLPLFLQRGKDIGSSVDEAINVVEQRAKMEGLSPIDEDYYSVIGQVGDEILGKVATAAGASTHFSLPIAWKMMIIDAVWNHQASLFEFISTFIRHERSAKDLYVAPAEKVQPKSWADIIRTRKSVVYKPQGNSLLVSKFISLGIGQWAPWMTTFVSEKPATFDALLEKGLFFPEMIGIEKSEAFREHTDGDLHDFFKQTYRLAFDINFDGDHIPYLQSMLKNGSLFSLAKVLKSRQNFAPSWDEVYSYEKEQVIKKRKPEGDVPPADGPKEERRPQVPGSAAKTILCNGKTFSRADLKNRAKLARDAGKEFLVLENFQFTIPFLEKIISDPASVRLVSNRDKDGKIISRKR